jgi:alpha-beta hydrolase superfamily lysophospholipase
MFDSHALAKLKKTFSPFTLERVCRTTNSDLPALYSYLEYYGFLYTLKGLGVEYFSGYRIGEGRVKHYGRIATHYWRLNEAKGTVFIVHGLFDHVGLYQPAVRFLLEQGFSVVALDLPGHGLSDGEPTHIRSFNDYADVVMDCLKYFQAKMQGPAFALGQSTGAAVILNVCFRAAAKGRQPFKGIVLLGPLLRCRRWQMVVALHRLVGWALSRVSRQFHPNSHDETFNRFLESGDILQSRFLTTDWVGAMRQWESHFTQLQPINLPCFIVQGSADKVVDWQHNLPLLVQKLPKAEVQMIEKAFHHLVNEAPEFRRPLAQGVKEFLARQTA